MLINLNLTIMPETEPTTPVNDVPKPSKTGNVPAKDLDFGNVVSSVSAKWTSNTWLTLKWANAPEFAVKVENYKNTLDVRLQTGSTRPQITKAMKVMEKKMDDTISYVKGYIIDKYKKDVAKSYYAAFGLVLHNKTYKLPKDQNARSNALTLMLKGIADNGFNDKEFGAEFWTAIKTEYDLLLQSATATDGQVSIKVGDKNELKTYLKKVLNAIVLVIKGNYPDTYKAELRDWGFQKEKY